MFPVSLDLANQLMHHNYLQWELQYWAKTVGAAAAVDAIVVAIDSAACFYFCFY